MTVESVHVFYDYCNLGGVTSIFKQRIMALRENGIDLRFHFYFGHDLGGMQDLQRLPGVSVEICNTESFRNWAYEISSGCSDPVILIDQPEILQRLTDRRHVVYEVHTSLEQTFKRMRGTDFLGLSGLICVSHWLKNKIFEVVPSLPRSNIHVIHNFVDMKLFKPFKPGQVVSSGAVPVLWVGKLNSDKNFMDALEILRNLTRSRSIQPIFVTGGGVDQQTQITFLSRLHAFGLLSSTRWLTNVPNFVMPKVINETRCRGGVLLSTSKYESFGLAVLEAMACGLPVVAGRAGGLTEILKDRQREHLFILGDNETAAAQIMGFLNDNKAYSEASRNMLEMSATFDPNRLALEYFQVIKGAFR